MPPMPPNDPEHSPLSIIIPAYNERPRLGATLEQIADYLRRRGLDAEVIVVDDGSSDGTAELAAETGARLKLPLQVIRNEVNAGKGASVRRGVAAAGKPIILFSDADLSTPIEEYEKLAQALANGADVAIGSRASEGSRIEVRQAWYRELMGKVFNRLVRLASGLSFPDTQCGFKAFRADAAKQLFGELRTASFGFDVEILTRAERRGLRVTAVPIVWRNSPHSRVNPITDSARMAFDLLLIRLRRKK